MREGEAENVLERLPAKIDFFANHRRSARGAGRTQGFFKGKENASRRRRKKRRRRGYAACGGELVGKQDNRMAGRAIQAVRGDENRYVSGASRAKEHLPRSGRL